MKLKEPYLNIWSKYLDCELPLAHRDQGHMFGQIINLQNSRILQIQQMSKKEKTTSLSFHSSKLVQLEEMTSDQILSFNFLAYCRF